MKEYKQKSLRELRAKFLGHTREEIDEFIETGEISYDHDLYRIIDSDRTISGLYPVFTRKRKRELLKITGLRRAAMSGLLKLDSLLQSGGKVAEVEPLEMYLSDKSRESGEPDHLICVYLDVPADDLFPTGCAEVIFAENGRFIRGSYAMVSGRETYIPD